MNETKISPWQMGKQAAAWFGLAVAVLWMLSFVLTVAGLTYPVLGKLGMAVGLFSFYRCGRLVRMFRSTVPKVTLSIAFRIVWLTMLLAALLTTMAQYIYFRWLDDGAFVHAYSTILHSDIAIEQALSMQGMNVDDALAMLSSLTAERWTMMIFIYNVFIATVFSPVALFFARTQDTKIEINGH